MKALLANCLGWPAKTLLAAATVLAAIALSVGCSSARHSPPFSPEIDSRALNPGKGAFMHYCNACHPAGEAGLGPSLVNKPLPRWAMRAQVRAGLGAMPSFSKQALPPEELDQLLNYIVAMRHQPQWPAPLIQSSP